jgi:ribosomal protein S6--L-glutamate ligase
VGNGRRSIACKDFNDYIYNFLLGETTMRFCFIVESQYRHDSMPMIVLQQLADWGHQVDMLEPQRTITSLSDLLHQHYDAYVLKTVSDGPGLNILDHSQAIRHVRDKSVAMAIAMAHGLPTPQTYFVSDPRLLNQIPDEQFPLVLKPNNGSSCRDIYYVSDPSELSHIDLSIQSSCFWLAQHYEKNQGFDTKLYVAGEQVFAIAKRSPLHPDISVEKRIIPLTSELRQLALSVGQIYNLDLYGLDIVETDRGPMVVDINDFPSFGNIPDAEKLVANCILQITLKRQGLHAAPSLSTSFPLPSVLAEQPTYVHLEPVSSSYMTRI